MAENTREHSIREKLLYREEPTGMEFLDDGREHRWSLEIIRHGRSYYTEMNQLGWSSWRMAENTREHSIREKLLYREEPTGMEFLEDGREHS